MTDHFSRISNLIIDIIFIAFLFNTLDSSSIQDVPKTNLTPVKHIDENNITAAENVSRYNRHLESDTENKFRINVNTIIRTGESRALGAKYLNETRLSSNRDCLTWCLETPSCNVAVYEEKNKQSCYMFDCGSPAKFSCKFTTHDFFISSFLKVSQHSYELSQWGKQVKQERELADLRSNDLSSSSLTSPIPADLKTVGATSVQPLGLERYGKTGNNCHHYQFQCLNNSECIAIYNVCDGIPQCPDGSDESVDLKCPIKGIVSELPNKPERPVESSHHSENKPSIQKPPLQLPHPPTTLKSPQKIQNPTYIKQNVAEQKELHHKESDAAAWSSRVPDGQITRNDYYHHIDDSDGLGSPFIHKHSQFVAANDPHVQNLYHWANDYDQYPQHTASFDQQYNPYDNNYQRMDDQYLPNQLPPEYDTGKTYGSYRQEDIPYWPNQDIVQDGGYLVDDLPQTGLHALNKQNGYPDKDNIYAQQITRTAEQYPETKHHIHKPLDVMPAAPQSRPSKIEDYKLRRFPLQRQQQPFLSYDESLQRQYPGYPDIKSKNYEPSQNVEDAMYSNDDLIRASIVNQLPSQLDQIHHFHEHDSKHVERTTVSHISHRENTAGIKEFPKDDSLIIVKPTQHSKAIQRTVLDFKMSVTELYRSSGTHSREANSAILALVTGLTITFLLFILLACRVKTLRRRMSRKGRGLAHDADYLVNGMYL